LSTETRNCGGEEAVAIAKASNEPSSKKSTTKDSPHKS
jgi:hypothetical protein